MMALGRLLLLLAVGVWLAVVGQCGAAAVRGTAERAERGEFGKSKSQPNLPRNKPLDRVKSEGKLPVEGIRHGANQIERRKKDTPKRRQNFKKPSTLD